MTSLGALLDWEADDPGDNAILSRLLQLVSTHLPEGWKNWKIHRLTREELLGNEMDPQILNKIRFAIPTVGLARAFSPNCTSLPEKTYRDIKLKLLDWPWCVGLIIGPASLAARIRGSAVQNELVSAALADMKPLLIGREEANRELIRENSDLDDDSSQISRSNSTTSKINRKRQDRLSRLEENQVALKEMLESFMNSFETRDEDADSQESYSDSSDDVFIPPGSPNKESQPGPANPVPWIPPENPIDSIEDDFDWLPTTKPQEPTIPTPKPHIAEQGIKVQRLGDIAYNQIRYADVQKKLHASPVFGTLKANPILLKYSPPNQMQEHLAKTDYILGTIIHGLLVQRDCMTTALKELSNKHPLIKEDLKSHLSTGSTTKTVSDDLLQFACGRRAEVIEQRRGYLIPKDEYKASLLNAIPPSTTHLFCEEKLSEVLKQPAEQTLFRANTGYRRQIRHQNNASTSGQARTYNGKITKKTFNKPRKHLPGKTPENRRSRDKQSQAHATHTRSRPFKGHSSKKQRNP